MDLEIVIEGVPDLRLSKAIERTIRQVCKEAACAGEWSVALYPSERRGEWDLGIRSPLGPRFMSFVEPVDRLLARVEQQLRACLLDVPRP
jgi:hypothetical protein